MRTYSKKKNSNGITYIFLAILFFLQLGYNYYFSFGCIGLLWFYYNYIKLSNNDNDILSILVVAVTTIISVFLTSIKYPNETIIYEREIRIFFLFIFLYLLLDANTKLVRQINFDFIVKFSAITLFAIVLVQLSSRLLGIVLLIPDTYYVISGDGALAYKVYEMSLDKGFEFRFRPTAFYSEPSFLGLILCSIFFISFYLKSSLKLTLYKILLIITAIISTSLLGITGIILLLLPRLKISTVYFVILSSLLALIVYGFQNVQIDRLDLLLTGNDESLTSRLLLPFIIIGLNFSNGDFFGTPFSINAIHFFNLGAYTSYDDLPFHNALLNIIINFGLSGIFIIYNFIFKLFDKHEIIFFIIVASQNGVLFDFNKVFILAFFILGKRYLEKDSIKSLTTTN